MSFEYDDTMSSLDDIRRQVLPDDELAGWISIAGERPDVIRENIKIQHQLEVIDERKAAEIARRRVLEALQDDRSKRALHRVWLGMMAVVCVASVFAHLLLS